MTLSSKDTFFDFSPSSFTINPGASVTVTIGVATQQSGFQSGSISVFVAGVTNPIVIPVRVFVGQPPAGTVTPVSTQTFLRIDGLSGSPHQASFNISNIGNVTMQGMLGTSVPWLVPQGDIVNIAPQQTGRLPFVSDPSQRDAIAPLGALTGKVSLLFLQGTGSGPGLADAPPSATVYDISKVSVVPTDLPAPAAGESILFLPGVTDSFFFTDVFFANRSANALSSDLKLFYTAFGAPPATSLLANAGRIASETAAWFPFAPSSLFNVTGQTGTIEFRTSDAASLVASALRGVQPDATNVYVTKIPLLRSDIAVGSGDRLLFAGVEKSASARTDILVQETAGYSGTYTIDFFDASGAPVAPNKTGSILPFGSVSLSDTVPAGARSARVTNTSSGAARLSGYGSVIDNSTADAWTIVDSSRGPAPTSDLVLPLPVVTGAASSSFDAWITNGSASQATVTIGTTPHAAKLRAVGNHPAASNAQTIVLAAGETRKISLTSAPGGYVRISGPRGAISASGRLTMTATGRAGSFGSGVAALPSARAIGLGGAGKHFWLDNFPPTLLLVEVANRPATVRVTIGYSFPAGATVSGHTDASKQFDVAPGQVLSIPDIVRTVIGPAADSLGTIISLTADVDVIGGDGRVLPYLETVNASGDVTVSVD